MDRDTDRREEYVARNVAVEIAPGRFSRDGWVRERWYEREGSPQPKRASEGKTPQGEHIKVRRAPGEPNPKKRGGGPMPRLKAVDCPQTKGHYRLDRIEPLPTGHSFAVWGICRGGHCTGRVRRFSVNEWVRIRPGHAPYACNLCSNAMRKAVRQAARAQRKQDGLPLYHTGKGGRA